MISEKQKLTKRLLYNKSFLTITNLEALDLVLSNPKALEIMLRYLDIETAGLIEFAFNTERVFLLSPKDDEDYKDFFYEKLYDALITSDENTEQMLDELDKIIIKYDSLMGEIKI